MRTHLMPWSMWVATAICIGSAISHRNTTAWLAWALAAAATLMIGVGIRSFTDTFHYREAQRLRNKGEDKNDQASPMD